jgi:NhaA family Na+:H+ antiporter
MIGAALLAGIGFTMSLFINELAFRDPDYRQQAKLGILIASVLAGSIGYFLIRRTPKERIPRT